ncbi:TlpA disulfide reductase family protein [Chloroflexota bacterium]
MWQRLLDRERLWQALIVGVMLLGGAWTWRGRVPYAEGEMTAAAVPQTGFTAPDFALDTLDGGTVTLSELRGQVVVINLWATWCPPCRAEMPAIERVWNEYRDDGLVVLAVNQREAPSRVGAFVEELGLTFPVLLDRDGGVGARYKLRAYPTTFFIDREGVIRDVVLGGPMPEELIASKVSKLLSVPVGVKE